MCKRDSPRYICFQEAEQRLVSESYKKADFTQLKEALTIRADQKVYKLLRKSVSGIMKILGNITFQVPSYLEILESSSSRSLFSCCVNTDLYVQN